MYPQASNDNMTFSDPWTSYIYPLGEDTLVHMFFISSCINERLSSMCVCPFLEWLPVYFQNGCLSISGIIKSANATIV